MQIEQSRLGSFLRKAAPVLIIVLCLVQPALDALTYWQTKTGLSVSVAFVPRAALMLLTAAAGFVLSKKKRVYLIAAGILAAFWAAHAFFCARRGYADAVTDLSNYVRMLTLPVFTVSLITLTKSSEKGFDALKKGLALALAEIILLALVSVLTGTEPHTYEDKQIGIRGWCIWPNTQSAILSVLCPVFAVAVAGRKPKSTLFLIAGTAAAMLCLWCIGTRLCYASLVALGIGLAVTVLITGCVPKRAAAFLLALTALFCAALPVSPMYKNRKATESTAAIRSVIFDELIAYGEEKAQGLTGTEYDEARLEPVYSYYLTDFVNTFGLEETLKAYDRADDPSIIPGVREYKLKFCRQLMKRADVPAMLFGLEISEMFVGHGFDVENDFHGIYFLYGWCGLGLMLVFLGFFLLRILLALIRDFKRSFTLEAAGFGIALCCCLVQAFCTCGVLRRSNALFYLAALLACIYCLTEKPCEGTVSKLLNKLKTKKGVLLTNTLMLYLLTFSDYLIGFLVVPKESRALGKEMFGVLSVATSMMVYFQLLIDFGFILSATEDVSNFRDDKKRLGSILTSVTLTKIAFSVLSAGVLLLLCRFFVPQWKEHTLFYMLFLVSTIISRLIPDFMYRGLEKMSAITVRAFAVKAFFGLMVVLFLKKPSDYILIPVFNIVGNAVALALVFLHLRKKLGIGFGRFDGKEFKRTFKRSLFFFFSRIASAVYSASNTLILSLMNGDTGLYGGAEKISNTAKNAMSPISDSLYPYMVKNKDFKLIKKVLLIAMPVIFAGCTVVFIFAEPLCVWFMGEEFAGIGNVLRTLIPAVFVILPSYILGFPTLSAMGLSKHANYSVLFGSFLHVLGLAVLYFTGNMNIYTLGCMVSVTETLIMLYRLTVVLKNRKLFSGKAEQAETLPPQSADRI